MKNKKTVLWMCFIYGVILVIYPHGDAFAQMIDSTINRGADYIISRLGPALFLFSIAVACCGIALGSADWIRRAVYVFCGGVGVLASHSIYNAIVSWAR